jgi:hypothetical protein
MMLGRKRELLHCAMVYVKLAGFLPDAGKRDRDAPRRVKFHQWPGPGCFEDQIWQ